MYTTRLGDHGQLLELLLVKLGLYTELLLAGLGFTKRDLREELLNHGHGTVSRGHPPARPPSSMLFLLESSST